MNIKNLVFNYLRLIRPQGGAATAIVVVIGSLLMMGEKNLDYLMILFSIGFFCHVFIFVLNEYADILVDDKSKNLKEKPLVSGVIPKKHALLIAFFACFCAYVLTLFFFLSFFSLLFLTLALLSGGIYDVLGKRIPGSDVFIAGGCFFGCLFGASTVSSDFTDLVYIVSFSIFFYILFSNAVVGGIKDADHDEQAGAKTTATRLGVKVKNGKIFITRKFTFFAYSAIFIYICLIVLAGFQPELNFWQTNKFFIHIILVSLIFIVMASLYKFWHPSNFNRSRLYRLFGINEFFAYSLAPLILLPMVGINVALTILLVPLFWMLIINSFLYGKPMHPNV